MGAHQYARMAARQGDFSAAMKCLEETPQGARDLNMHPHIQDQLRGLVPLPPPPPCWGMETFGSPPPWDHSRALILTGRTGLGKSSLAQSMMPGALFCSQIEDLRDYRTEMNGIIFDDMSFRGDLSTGKGAWPIEAQIHLLDWDHPRAIRLRYKNFVIPAHTRKIFTTNKVCWEILETKNEAIRRRTTGVLVFGEPLKLKYTVLWSLFISHPGVVAYHRHHKGRLRCAQDMERIINDIRHCSSVRRVEPHVHRSFESV